VDRNAATAAIRGGSTSQPGEPTLAFAVLPGPRGVTALYNRLDPIKVQRVVAEHLESGVIVRDLIERPAPLVPPGDRRS
jgi:(2Fe-2S) ferredoxin